MDLGFAFALLAICAAADVVTTRECVRAGLFEANPLMRPFVGNIAKALAAKTAGLLVMGWAARELAAVDVATAVTVVIGAALFNAWLAVRNVRLLLAISRRPITRPLVVWRGEPGYDDAAEARRLAGCS